VKPILITRQVDGTFIDSATGQDISHLITAYKALVAHERRVQVATMGGKAKSPARAAASRRNGAKGGRPRKVDASS
jgi:hypothetical protein